MIGSQNISIATYRYLNKQEMRPHCFEKAVIGISDLLYLLNHQQTWLIITPLSITPNNAPSRSGPRLYRSIRFRARHAQSHDSISYKCSAEAPMFNYHVFRSLLAVRFRACNGFKNRSLIRCPWAWQKIYSCMLLAASTQSARVCRRIRRDSGKLLGTRRCGYKVMCNIDGLGSLEWVIS